jgi:aryl-alcohol dehydrogenase-like predicted oxidoreductase
MPGNHHRATFTRRAVVKLAGVMLAGSALADASTCSGVRPMLTRAIPSSQEPLPVIGLGTYRGFDVAPSDSNYRNLPAVLDALFEHGGSVIDSSPMYGRAEQTTGELLAGRSAPPSPFLATKVWTRGRAEGIAQMERSFQLLQTERIDLMQIHNLLDWPSHLPTLRQWKEQGRIRYIGISHYTASAYAEVEALLRAEPMDFLQINYALDDRQVEHRLLALCQERGVAVICNRPFGGGGLLGRLRSVPLPAWAGEVQAASWSQLALKFVLSHPAVTSVIPGTGNPRYMAENASAGFGPLLDAAQRKELIRLVG